MVWVIVCFWNNLVKDLVGHYIDLWCLASNISIAADTETFIESISPSMGIMMFCVEASNHSFDKPVDSVPTTIAAAFCKVDFGIILRS